MGERFLSDSNLSAGEKIDRLCTVIPCVFSLIGTLSIVLSIGFFKKLQTVTFYMVGIQALSESIFNTGRIIFYTPPEHQDWRSGHMYLMITRRTYKLTSMGLAQLSVVVFFVSLGLALIPLATNQYQNIGAECWIAGNGEYGTTVQNGTLMRFLAHYSIIWAICLFCAWSYITIFKYIQQLRDALRNSVKSVDGERSDVEKTVFRLQYYPAILILVWLPITACRIYSSIYPHRYLANWALGSAHALLNSQGWLNALVFCSYPSVYKAWLDLLGLKRLSPSLPSRSNTTRSLPESGGSEPSSSEEFLTSTLNSITNAVSSVIALTKFRPAEALLSPEDSSEK